MFSFDNMIAVHQKVAAAVIVTVIDTITVKTNISTVAAAAAVTRNVPEMIAVMITAVRKSHGKHFYNCYIYTPVHSSHLYFFLCIHFSK